MNAYGVFRKEQASRDGAVGEPFGDKVRDRGFSCGESRKTARGNRLESPTHFPEFPRGGTSDRKMPLMCGIRHHVFEALDCFAALSGCHECAGQKDLAVCGFNDSMIRSSLLDSIANVPAI